MTYATIAILKRDLLKAARNQSDVLQPIIFFVLCVSLFPFAVGPESTVLGAIGPGIVWVSALLAASLSLDGQFRADYLDGSLEFVTLSGTPLVWVALSKALSHWAMTGLPIAIMSVPFAHMLEIPSATARALVLGLLLGTPYLSFIGCTISALTVGLRGGGMLLVLLILPLYIPVLIFGTAAARNATLGLPIQAELYFLAGLLTLAVTLTPWATAAAIKVRLS